MDQQVFFPRTLDAFREAVQARARTPGAVEEARLEHCLKRFIGPRPESLLNYYRQGQMHLSWRQTGPSVWLKRFMPHWPALLAPMVWLFYRKLNTSAVLFACVAFAAVLLQTWAALGIGIALNIATALLARFTYVGHGVALVREADERFASPDQRLAWLEQQGGASLEGAGLGLLLTAAQWALPFLKPLILATIASL